MNDIASVLMKACPGIQETCTGVCKCNLQMAQWHTFPRGCVQVQPTDGTMAYFSKGVCASATYRWHNGILFQGGVCKCNLQMAQWHTFPRGCVQVQPTDGTMAYFSKGSLSCQNPFLHLDLLGLSQAFVEFCTMLLCFTGEAYTYSLQIISLCFVLCQSRYFMKIRLIIFF